MNKSYILMLTMLTMIIIKEIHYGYEQITLHNKVFNANNAIKN